MNIRRFALATLAVLAILASPIATPSAAADKPLRSGRITGILITTGDTGPCRTQPDCALWLESRCDRRLTRRNPAVYTSIEPVGSLADGVTPRRLTITSPVGTGWIFAGVLVEFWSKDCAEISPSEWSSAESPFMFSYGTLVIPRGAKWMTVAGGQGFDISWSLR